MQLVKLRRMCITCVYTLVHTQVLCVRAISVPLLLLLDVSFFFFFFANGPSPFATTY